MNDVNLQSVIFFNEALKTWAYVSSELNKYHFWILTDGEVQAN